MPIIQHQSWYLLRNQRFISWRHQPIPVAAVVSTLVENTSPSTVWKSHVRSSNRQTDYITVFVVKSSIVLPQCIHVKTRLKWIKKATKEDIIRVRIGVRPSKKDGAWRARLHPGYTTWPNGCAAIGWNGEEGRSSRVFLQKGSSSTDGLKPKVSFSGRQRTVEVGSFPAVVCVSLNVSTQYCALVLENNWRGGGELPSVSDKIRL